MSVCLSAASCLAWAARLTGQADAEALVAEVERADRDPGPLLFLPYLSGERTPHNDPHAMGVFFGLTHASERADLGRAVLEGVAFALADGLAALLEAGERIGRIAVIGGAARSGFWRRILASALDRPLEVAAGAELGPAFGAARLARLAATGEDPAAVCRRPAPEERSEPDLRLALRYRERLARFRALYGALRERFAESAAEAPNAPRR
jgi:xylulokinase